MKLYLLAICILLEFGALHAFAPSSPSFHLCPRRNAGVAYNNKNEGSHLFLADTAADTSNRTRRKKKTVQDRTKEEAVSLIRDVVQAAVDAGPRAGPRRTLQAYQAFSSTVQEFVPQLFSGRASLSLPRILRTLFERLGATYVKLGQFIASSPTLFPKEYVVEFQKCLDQTEP